MEDMLRSELALSARRVGASTAMLKHAEIVGLEALAAGCDFDDALQFARRVLLNEAEASPAA